MTTSSKRLLSLDTMRGITVAAMILLGTQVDGNYTYALFRHAPWNGLTISDTVFPFFIFIMGISTCFSLNKYDFRPMRNIIQRILIRSLSLILIGWVIEWFDIILEGIYNRQLQLIFCFDYIRFTGVLFRLGLCYGASALLALWLKPRALLLVTVAFLCIYTLILTVGNGYSTTADNVIARLDIAVFGEEHIITDWNGATHIKFDPEGILSTIPSIAHCIIGLLCGLMILRTPDATTRALNLLVAGIFLSAAGILLKYGLPINKKIWSPTFVLTTCGMAAVFLGMLIWIIDIKKYQKWTYFFKIFGVNPLFLYVLAEVFYISARYIHVSTGTSLNTWLYQCMTTILDNHYMANLSVGAVYLTILFVIGYILYRKKIFISL